MERKSIVNPHLRKIFDQKSRHPVPVTASQNAVTKKWNKVENFAIVK